MKKNYIKPFVTVLRCGNDVILTSLLRTDNTDFKSEWISDAFTSV